MNCPITLAKRFYCRFVQILSSLRHPFILILRLYWGWQFFQTGMGKLNNLENVTKFFQSLGIPYPAFNATMAGLTETIGGILLFIGLASRLISLQLTILLTVAYLTADSDAVRNIFIDPDDFISKAPFHFMMVTLIVMIFGPGLFSVDTLLARVFGKKCNQSDQCSTTISGV